MFCLLQNSSLQHVCIFCAVRRQIVASVARSLPRRRPIQSGRVLFRPPATTVAQKEDDKRLPASQRDFAQVDRGLGRRVRRVYPSPLTDQELKSRETQRETSEPRNQDRNLQNDASSLEPKFAIRRTNNFGVDLRETARAISTGISSNQEPDFNEARTLEPKFAIRRINKFRLDPRATARATSTGINVRRTSNQEPDFNEARTDGLNISHRWNHMRLPTPPTETDPDTFIDSDRGLGSENPQNHRLDAERIRLEESRRARLERTKDGKFVQLGTAVQQDASGSLGSGKKITSWKAYVSGTSQDTESPPNSFDDASDGLQWWNEQPAPTYSYMAETTSQNHLSRFVERPIRQQDEISNQLARRFRNTSLEGNFSDAGNTSSPADVPNARNQRIRDKRWSPSAEEDSPVIVRTLASRSEASSQHQGTRSIFGPDSIPSKFEFEHKPDGRDRYTRGDPRHRDADKRRYLRRKSYEDDEEETNPIERKRKKMRKKNVQKQSRLPKKIYLPEFITVSNLATVLKVRVEDFGFRLRALGFEATNNDLILDAETAGLIAVEFNFEPIIDTDRSDDLVARPPAIDVSLLPARPPVVTIMGHVDHGKTTLLDWLRKSSVAASEHGGITQHIGAFSVSMPGGKLITFLDTPGHAAFLSMRERGANVTDIVILVVAADDSVKPQTVEAIKHAQAAKVPMIVAVSKIDKQDADVERVKQDLARYGVEIEDFGGDTQVVCISAKTGQGMAELEDAAIALADIQDMRAETDGPAEGWVVESTTNKIGRIATVLVRRGTISRGDILVAGLTWAKVRSMRNEAGTQVTAAGPGTPVEIDGWKNQPVAGDEVLQAPNEKRAKSVVERRNGVQKSSQMAVDMEAVNEARRLEQEKRELEKVKAWETQAPAAAATAGETIASASKALALEPSHSGVKEVFFFIKADVSGSVEAVLNSVSALGNSEVCAHVLRSGVGPVTEFDIEHAAAAKAHIICFNVALDPKTAYMAEAAGLKILDQRIIYKLVDNVKAILSEHLKPIITQMVLGEAEVAQIFEISIKNKVTTPVAGCKVRYGVVSRNNKVRVLRGKEVIYDGKLLSFLLSPFRLRSSIRTYGQF